MNFRGKLQYKTWYENKIYNMYHCYRNTYHRAIIIIKKELT